MYGAPLDSGIARIKCQNHDGFGFEKFIRQAHIADHLFENRTFMNRTYLTGPANDESNTAAFS